MSVAKAKPAAGKSRRCDNDKRLNAGCCLDSMVMHVIVAPVRRLGLCGIQILCKNYSIADIVRAKGVIINDWDVTGHGWELRLTG